jgi:hypothetical protein
MREVLVESICFPLQVVQALQALEARMLGDSAQGGTISAGSWGGLWGPYTAGLCLITQMGILGFFIRWKRQRDRFFKIL